jgi:predicted DNA-binding transcriptional regulator YafY
MAVDKKAIALFKLMKQFLIQKEISIDDAYLLEEFECSSKTLERYLKDIEDLYDHIITIKKGRKKVWKLIKVSDIFEEFIKNSEDLHQLFLMAREFDPEIFKELEKGTLSKIAKKDDNIFIFKNYIMEDIKDPRKKEIFQDLKKAIKNHEYRDIEYKYNTVISYTDAKPIKLLFMDNNWYVVIIDNKKDLKILRISFIEKVSKRTYHTKFQTHDLDPYIEFLSRIQNSLTLYNVKPKRAKILAKPKIAKYFEDGMKKFLLSQQYQNTLEDGSIIFTLEYTQELEILPYIQRWMPDLVILEPQELKEAYIKKLKTTIENHL